MTAPLAEDLGHLLVVLPSWVGDTVMATPLLRALRQARPQARIIGAMRGGLDEVLAGTPWLDETIVAETKTLLGPARIARRVRALAPDLDACLLLPNSFRSALIGRLARARRRLGYDRGGRGMLLTDLLEPGDRATPVPAIEYYARLAEWALGAGAIERRPELAVTESERAAAGALLEGAARPYVVLVPGANRPDKRWPAARFAALATALAEGHGLAAVATGSPAERDVVAAVAAAAGGAVTDLVARGLSLSALKGLIAEAALVVTNDTGPRHLAVALGTPVVALFGPTDHRWTTTHSPHERVLVAEPFLPEALVADERPGHCAIDRITTGDVLAASAALLAAAPSPGGAVPSAAGGAIPPPESSCS